VTQLEEPKGNGTLLRPIFHPVHWLKGPKGNGELMGEKGNGDMQAANGLREGWRYTCCKF